MADEQQDFIVSELLSELKEENERKSKLLAQKEKTLRFIISIFLLVLDCSTLPVYVWFRRQWFR